MAVAIFNNAIKRWLPSNIDWIWLISNSRKSLNYKLISVYIVWFEKQFHGVCCVYSIVWCFIKFSGILWNVLVPIRLYYSFESHCKCVFSKLIIRSCWFTAIAGVTKTFIKTDRFLVSIRFSSLHCTLRKYFWSKVL